MILTVTLHPQVELADGTSVLLRKITYNNFMWTPNPVTNMEMNTCLHQALKSIRLKEKMSHQQNIKSKSAWETQNKPTV
jgi:hypothetical protein